MGKHAGVKTGRHSARRVTWTQDDVEFLKLSFPELRNDELQVVFPEKPLRTILTKASDLGVKKRTVSVLTGLIEAVPLRSPEDWYNLRKRNAVESYVKQREEDKRVLQAQIIEIDKDIAAHLNLID